MTDKTTSQDRPWQAKYVHVRAARTECNRKRSETKQQQKTNKQTNKQKTYFAKHGCNNNVINILLLTAIYLQGVNWHNSDTVSFLKHNYDNWIPPPGDRRSGNEPVGRCSHLPHSVAAAAAEEEPEVTWCRKSAGPVCAWPSAYRDTGPGRRRVCLPEGAVHCVMVPESLLRPGARCQVVPGQEANPRPNP